MRRLSAAVVLVGVFAVSVSAVLAGQSSVQRPAPVTAPSPAAASGRAAAEIVATYCAGCHDGAARSPSGAPLDEFDVTRIQARPDVWARAYRQLLAQTMPPVGASRPDRAGYDAVLAAIEAALVPATPPAAATSQEIADRLARLLWNGPPDAALLDDVRRNRLTAPAALEGQITRMLSDERARALVTRFFFPWLGLDRLENADPDKAHFPDYDVSLREAMKTETELFLLAQLRENRDPIDLWNADDTFLNEQLARHYGIPGVTGRQFRRVVLTSPERRGLLGQGSVLMATSRHQHGPDAGYTSPAARAVWIRLHFLGAMPPNAFPNAQPVKPELPITPQTRTLPADPCANCHRNFFPLGYALENFDPIGRWRTHDQAGPVDASGSFVDGTPANGVVELRQVLLQRPDAFRMTVTEQLVAYAAGSPSSGQRMTPETLIRARAILRDARAVRWSSIIAGLVRTVPPAP